MDDDDSNRSNPENSSLSNDVTTHDPLSLKHEIHSSPKPSVSHIENNTWPLKSPIDGDTALALLNDASVPHQPITPDEERRLVRKIDFMILPYLAVCYAFFYIDKTTLSYAALFGIREDLGIVG